MDFKKKKKKLFPRRYFYSPFLSFLLHVNIIPTGWKNFFIAKIRWTRGLTH